MTVAGAGNVACAEAQGAAPNGGVTAAAAAGDAPGFSLEELLGRPGAAKSVELLWKLRRSTTPAGHAASNLVLF